MSIKLPAMPEAVHPLVQPWQNKSDAELVELIQQHPDQGRYFTALFCRYGAFVYTLLGRHAKTALQVDYIFARTWRRIFAELTQPSLNPDHAIPTQDLITWIAEQTSATILLEPLPPIEDIQYSLAAAPPPLWCYLEAALEQMSPETRLIMVMAQTFHWSTDRILAYFEAEGENVAPIDLQVQIEQGYQVLEKSLPEDISEIYLTSLPEPSAA
jgi:hypothetical protein